MLLTFGCPRCGKEYDLPWSLAGKKARCKRCSVEFVIPAPLEPKGPRSSEAIPVFDASPSSQPTGPRPIAAQDPPPIQLLVALRSGLPASTRKLEGPGSVDSKAEPQPPPSGIEAERPASPPTRPIPRPNDPLFPTTPRSSVKAERRRPRTRPLRDEDDFEPDSIDPVTGSRRPPAWLIPTFVIADLVIILIVVGQIARFVGIDAVDDDEPNPPVRGASLNPGNWTSGGRAENSEPAGTPDAAYPPTNAPVRPSQKQPAADLEPAGPGSNP